MIQCPVCQVAYVANTLFCTECGLYLLSDEELGTDPFETVQVKWQGESNGSLRRDIDLPNAGPPTIYLRISNRKSSLDHLGDKGNWSRELEIPLVKPICLGRIDPTQNVFPDVDLTDDLAMERGVSREHTRIFRQGNAIAVEDLASTNGTLLNGKRLAPYIPEILKDGDQIQLGKLLIEVSFETHHSLKTPTRSQIARGVVV